MASTKVIVDSAKGLYQQSSASGGFEVGGDVPLTISGDVTLTGANLTMTGVTQSGMLRKVITAGRVLTSADSGALLLPNGAAQTFTLPSPLAGLHFKMYATTAAAHKLQVGASGKIYGNAINTNNEQAEIAEGQKVDNKSAVAFGAALQTGDFMEVVCDGNNWFLHAVTNDPLTLTA